MEVMTPSFSTLALGASAAANAWEKKETMWSAGFGGHVGRNQQRVFKWCQQLQN
jgi:hypothetical protein